jgi:hypothetical protein
MTRAAPPEMIAASLLGTVSPGFAVEVQYPDGPVRLCSLPYPVTIEGNAFNSGAGLGAIGRIEQGAENRSYGFTLSLTGIPAEFAAYLRGQDPHGGRVTVWFLLVNNATHALIGARRIRTGRMDTQDVTAGDTLAVTVQVEAFNLDWERPRVDRVTDQSQQDAHPGDRLFKFVAALPNLILAWGRT